MGTIPRWDAGGDRGTARQTAGSGAQGSRGQEGAAARGRGGEGRRGTSVQSVGRPERSSFRLAAERADLVTNSMQRYETPPTCSLGWRC